MSARPTAHPDLAKLAAFAQGRFSEPDATMIESHLDVCEACGSLVDQLQPDPFISALRRAARLETPSGCLVDAPTAAFFGDTTIPDVEPIPAELATHPRYRLGSLLERGGMGAVYKAEHTLMERPVAVKVIAPRLLEHPGAVERFMQEVKAAAKLHHPNIVTAFDAEQVGPVTVLVMEFIEGRSLADVLVERGSLPVAKACEYARQAALGLAHAHALRMVHRDVKPHNLMLAADGCVKILDFGLARFVSEGLGDRAPETVPEPGAPTTEGLTGTGTVMGTLDYMAPEQARDARAADARADVYALGCTLYHLLAGRVPFPGGNGLEKLNRLTSDEPTPLAELRPDLPPALAALVARLMAKQPEDRVASAAEAGELLLPFTREAEPPRRSRRKWWAALATAALVAGVVIANTVIKVPTEQGELQIETDDPDIEVVVKGDRVVHIRDPKSGREYAIDRQNLTLGEFDGDGLQVTLDGKTPVVLKRNGQKIASVRVVPKPTEASSEPPITPGQLIRDIRWPGGAQSVYSTGISPDGRYFIATGDTAVCSCRVWEVANCNEVANLPGCEHGVFLSDSRHLLTATPERQLALWDVTTGREVKRFAAHADWINSVGVSADSRLALASDNSGTVRMYEVATGKELFGRRVSQGHCFAAISPDGKRVATESCVSRSIQIWDAETGKELRSWSVTPSGVHKLWFLADGRSVLDLRADGTLTRWHEAEAAPTPVLKLGPGVLSAGLSADGRILAVGFAHESAVRTYDLTSGRELGRVVVPTAGYATLAVSPDGRLGAAAAPTGVTGGHARVYLLQFPSRAGLSGGTELEGTWTKVSGADVGVVVPSGADPDTLVISGYRWQYVKGGLVIQAGTFTLDTSKEPKEFTFTVTAGGNVGGVGYAIYKRDGDTFVFCTRDGDPVLRPTDFTLKPGDGRYLQTWTKAPARTTPGTQTGRAVSLPPVVLSSARMMTGQKEVRAVTASPDGKWLYSCGYDNTLRRWEAASGREVGRVGDAADPFDYLDHSRDGSKLLVAHRDKTVRLWDTTTGETLKTFKGHTDLVCGVTLSADGQRALSCGHDLTVRLWDVEEAKELMVLSGHKAMVRQLAFLPDDRAVSCAHDKTVRLWDLKEGKQLKQYGPFESWLCALDVLPGGTRVAVGTGISPIILDLETGEVVRRFRGHTQAVHAVTVSPDGKLLATGGEDKKVIVHELAIGRAIRTLEGHIRAVLDLGRYPAGGS